MFTRVGFNSPTSPAVRFGEKKNTKVPKLNINDIDMDRFINRGSYTEHDIKKIVGYWQEISLILYGYRMLKEDDWYRYPAKPLEDSAELPEE